MASLYYYEEGVSAFGALYAEMKQLKVTAQRWTKALIGKNNLEASLTPMIYKANKVKFKTCTNSGKTASTKRPIFSQ